jgi:cystathionine beta-lyase/cystathionine gamma-synthase
VAKQGPSSGGSSDARIRTRLIHGVQHTGRWDYNHHVVPPITASATYRLESAARGAMGFEEFAEDKLDPKTHPTIYIYDRLNEPTCGMLEDNLALAEGGEVAVCFASGMAAISAAICILAQSGHHLIAHNLLYGCTCSLITNWLPRLGITHTLVDLLDLDVFRRAIRPTTRVVYFETPVNPDLKLIDISAVQAVIAEVNRDREVCDHIRMIVDNTFATPFCQRPLEHGADLVCQSLTKGIGGFGTDIGGAVIGSKRFHRDLIFYRKDFGGCLSPKSAWPPLVQGLPTLAMRMANYQKSAMEVAKFLESHPKIKKVAYPGLESFPQYKLARKQMVDHHGRFAPGSIVYFELLDPDGNGERAARFIDWVAKEAYSLTLAVSLGQIKTLIEAPFCMTHAAMTVDQKRTCGLSPSGVRLSLGLEDWQDIIEDLRAALEHV